ncbi:MAG: RlpA-like double-psi beta-barrel domain-containing protein [Pseudomonadota bacterium]
MRRVALSRRNGAGVSVANKYCARMLAIFALIAASWAGATTMAVMQSAQAKTPGKVYCFNRVCHRVKTLSETRREIGRDRVVQASHYDDCRRDRFNPCGLTSSGEKFRANDPDNAASPIYPDGTKLLVWNPRNGKTLVVRINNAGPYYSRRLLDLSRGAARKLGFAHRGIARLHVRVLSAPSRREARYRRNRRYSPVPGYIGKFRSMDAALWRVARRHGGWAGNPASVMAQLALDEAGNNPGWLSLKEMQKTAWRLRQQRRKKPKQFVVQASTDIPLPNSKAGVKAAAQVLRVATMEFGLDKADRIHESLQAKRSTLLAALPERRPVRVKPKRASRKLAALARKRKAPLAGKKAVAKKTSRRRVRVAQLNRRADPKRTKRKASDRKQLAKNKATKQRQRLRVNKDKRARKKPIRVASAAQRRSTARNVSARNRKPATTDKRTKTVSAAKLKTTQPTQKVAPQKTASGKPKLPSEIKKTERPAPRVARSNWRVGVMRGGREL